MRWTREDFTSFGSVISLSVIESMMILNRRSRACVLSISESFSFAPTPGINEASLRMGPGLLPVRGVDYEEPFVRFDRLRDGLDFRDQVLLECVAAGRVDDDDVGFRECFHARLGDLHGVLRPRVAVERRVDLLG